MLPVESEEGDGEIDIAKVCTHMAWYRPLAVKPQRGMQFNCSLGIASEDGKFVGERENLLNGAGGMTDFAPGGLHKYRDDSFAVTSQSQSLLTWRLSLLFLLLMLL